MPDNVILLHKLEKKGLIIRTPPQDYDDSYCIRYAKQKNAYMVTNDKFRDYINKFEGKEKVNERKWIQQHSVSYTFHKDEFIANPDSQLYSDCQMENYKNYPLEDL